MDIIGLFYMKFTNQAPPFYEVISRCCNVCVMGHTSQISTNYFDYSKFSVTHRQKLGNCGEFSIYARIIVSDVFKKSNQFIFNASKK